MNLPFSVEDAVLRRVSVRNYKMQAILDKDMQSLLEFIQSLKNPFNGTLNFHFFTQSNASLSRKLGTYGVIKGAQHFMGTSIKLEGYALEACGYAMEMVMLYLASQGIGSCWLGGTFDHKAFTRELNIPSDEVLLAISPMGYAHDHRHLQEIVMQRIVKARQRSPWELLFFDTNFETPLNREKINNYAFACDMVRLAPSASNKQPWRIVYDTQGFHFYEYKSPGYSSMFPYDIQRIDMGIAAAHFEAAAWEKGLAGYFSFTHNQSIVTPKNMLYAFSWVI